MSWNDYEKIRQNYLLDCATVKSTLVPNWSHFKWAHVREKKKKASALGKLLQRRRKTAIEFRSRVFVAFAFFFLALPAMMMDVLCDSTVSLLYFHSFFLGVFNISKMDVSLMAPRLPVTARAAWLVVRLKRNGRKLVGVKFPAAARFDSTERGPSGSCASAMNEHLTVVIFVYFPRLSTYFPSVSIEFIYFLPAGCALSPSSALPPQCFPCPRLRQTSVHAGQQIRCEFISLAVPLFVSQGRQECRGGLKIPQIVIE